MYGKQPATELVEASRRWVKLCKKQLIIPSRVKEGLQTKIFGHPLLYFRELASTNDIAKELAMRGAKEGTVVVAETQTRGRGRLKRRWISPEGGLWLSIILRPKTEPKHALKLTLMSSVAVAKTISKLFQLGAEIKWPNDVLINHKKVCGILIEAKTKGEDLDFAVVGIGINANFRVNALPSSLRDFSTTLKEELKREIEREALLRALLEETEAYYNMFSEGKFETILKEWRSSASFIGSYVQIVSHQERIEGWAADIDADGALMVKLKDQTMRKVASGDLTILRIED